MKWNAEQKKFFRTLIVLFGVKLLSELFENFLNKLNESDMQIPQIEDAYQKFNNVIKIRYEEQLQKAKTEPYQEVSEFWRTNWLNNPQVKAVFMEITETINNLFFFSKEI